MSKSDEKFVRWQDGLLSPEEAAAFAAELDSETRREAESWPALQAQLREHLKAPPLEHPEFLRNRIENAIAHEDRPARPVGMMSWRLAWGGIAALVVAGIITAIGMPSSFQPASEQAFISQVIEARAGNPKSTVSTFQAPDSGGVVLWIDGTGFIPPNEKIR